MKGRCPLCRILLPRTMSDSMQGQLNICTKRGEDGRSGFVAWVSLECPRCGVALGAIVRPEPNGLDLRNLEWLEDHELRG
jgi:hypothetical protein